MNTPLDNYYLNLSEPNQGCMLALKDIILGANKTIVHAWKYKMPFFTVNGKLFCYLWIDKKTHIPYIGFVQGINLSDPDLVAGNRSFIKILYVNPNKDIPLRKITKLLKQSLIYYK